MTPPTLTELTATHRPRVIEDTGQQLTVCSADEEVWPCDAAVLLGTVEENNAALGNVRSALAGAHYLLAQISGMSASHKSGCLPDLGEAIETLLVLHPMPPTATVLCEVSAERARQELKFPGQHLPDGTGPKFAAIAKMAKERCKRAAENGTLTWTDVLDEEFTEAVEIPTEDQDRIRAELVQVAAVAVRWIEDIDSRAHNAREQLPGRKPPEETA